jgi:hypothetical protein
MGPTQSTRATRTVADQDVDVARRVALEGSQLTLRDDDGPGP